MEKKRLFRRFLKDRFYHRRFLVPNAVTLGNMFCGFLACIYSAAGRYDKAAIAILVAIALDGLDGRLARSLNATSKFGVEFDSFSDLVSFGVAPAILIYHWSYRPYADEFGVLLAFVYVLCAASRLARFNIADEHLQGFTGLPTPGAAAVVASIVHFIPHATSSMWLTVFGGLLMPLLAFLMVSRIDFFSIKLLRISSIGFLPRVALGAAIALLWYNNRIGILLLSVGYGLSGPIGLLGVRFGWFGKRSKLSASTKGDRPKLAKIK